MRFILIRLIVNAVALWAAASWINGIHLEGTVGQVILLALIFGLVNAIIKPIVKILAFPLIILTLGLLTLVINALMLMLTAAMTDILKVDGFIPALLGSIVISLVSLVLSHFLDKKAD
ncbi:MAG: phage holin family protein [candidate division Zixibacteria bacterium]|nr:phage holin family protein [candidate division Zixibacteria bacterium]